MKFIQDPLPGMEDPGYLKTEGGYLTPEAINAALDVLWYGTCPVCGKGHSPEEWSDEPCS